MSQLSQGGTPDPLDFRRARPVLGENDEFRASTDTNSYPLSNTDPTVALVPIAGALLYRLRGKISTTESPAPSPLGVLSFAYRRSPPNQATAYDTSLDGPASPINITSGTEFLVDIEPGGESVLAITFTPDGAVDPGEEITVDFLDQMQQ